MADPQFLALLQNGKFHDFNDLVQKSTGEIDLAGARLRAHDLRLFHLHNVNLNGAYLRLADLRGLDLSHTNLEGASLRDAKISGVLFPANLSPAEIQMSVLHGTRLRVRS